MKEETVLYTIHGKTFKGFWAFPDGSDSSTKKSPAVIVSHAWMGLDDFAKDQARKLASLGYIGFAADVYGDGIVVTLPADAEKLMIPLFENRAELQSRIKGAFDLVSKHPLVDSERIGGIGFCFGGLTIIELLRTGAPVKGVVSFHGVLGHKMGAHIAKVVPIAQGIKGSLLVLHGHEDPLVSSQDIADFEKEFSDAGVDWELNIYSHTSHAFTNPKASDHANGMFYQKKTSLRAFAAMDYFFREVFK